MMTSFSEYLKPGNKGHLIGIGGVSMSPLAEVLSGMGLVIKGSDMRDSRKSRVSAPQGHRGKYRTQS